MIKPRRGDITGKVGLTLTTRPGTWIPCLLSLATALAIAQSDTVPAPKTPTRPKTTHSTANPNSTTHHSKTSSKTASRKSSSNKKLSKTSRKRGQQVIDSNRARAIQQALIREHYMQGEPTGKWDAATQEAMQRYQAHQGWQSKTTPDSRALIKLGLGPSNDHLLNPESAMTSSNAPVANAPGANTSGANSSGANTSMTAANPKADPKPGTKPAPSASDPPADRPQH